MMIIRNRNSIRLVKKETNLRDFCIMKLHINLSFHSCDNFANTNFFFTILIHLIWYWWWNSRLIRLSATFSHWNRLTIEKEEVKKLESHLSLIVHSLLASTSKTISRFASFLSHMPYGKQQHHVSLYWKIYIFQMKIAKRFPVFNSFV